MSTKWTQEMHRTARVLANAAPREPVVDMVRMNALRLALNEIERLRSLPGDPAAVERAVAAHHAHSTGMQPKESGEYAACAECGWAFGWMGPTDPPGAQRVQEHSVRAALRAALNPED